MTFDPNETPNPGAKIKVLGVGGGGTNAVSTMVKEGIEGVDFISANTDIQSLRSALAPTKIQIGKELTKGLGAGADPDIGRDAALEDRYEIQEALTGSDMVFVTAGMGGGTGTGSAAIVSQIARELGALTVGVVTKPFLFEGKRRRKHAEIGIQRLKEHVDTLITIPNQRLLQIAKPDLSLVDAFQMVDRVLVNAVRGISDIINIPGTVNVDFADVKTIMSSMGQALMGIGTATGENRAVDAAKQAILSPLLEDVNIEGATGILINITSGTQVSLMEVNEACMIVQNAAHEDADIIFGAVIDENLGEDIQVTVIATGFPIEEEDEFQREQQVQQQMLGEMSSQKEKSICSRPPPEKIVVRQGGNFSAQRKLTRDTVTPATHKPLLTRPVETKAPPAPPVETQKFSQQPQVQKTVEEHVTQIKEVHQTTETPTPERVIPPSPSMKISYPPIKNPTPETPQEETSYQQNPPQKETLYQQVAPPTSSYKTETPLTPQPDFPSTSSFNSLEESAPHMTNDSYESYTNEEPQEMYVTEEPHERRVEEHSPANLSDEIDNKIDEALELVDRINSVKTEEDNLDVPTFLRKPLNHNMERTKENQSPSDDKSPF